ncbi:MAG: hypothetical protein IIA88_02175, partial [Bacteroidetes bacterium]|nr:hypothetical protein [Bacteroidota bacterium]
MKILFLLLFTLFFYTDTLCQGIPIGTWRTHLSYSVGKSVAIVGNKVYCATESGFFYFDKDDNSLRPLSKIDGFSDINISKINYNAKLDILLIGYENGNIDLLKGNEIINVNDIERSNNIVGEKTINHIYFAEFKDRNGIDSLDLAYLSCAFGIVVLNLSYYNPGIKNGKLEVKETYSELGNNGAQIEVFGTTMNNDSLFLATANGVMAARLAPDINLLDFNNWLSFIDSTVYNFTVEGNILNSVAFMYDISWNYTYDTITGLVDSISKQQMQIVIYANQLPPYIPIDTLKVWPAYYNSYSYLIDTIYFDSLAYSFMVDGNIYDSIAFMYDTSWAYTFNTDSLTIDSFPKSQIQLILFNDSVSPFVPTDTLIVWPTYYNNYQFDILGNATDSSIVFPDSIIYLSVDTITFFDTLGIVIDSSSLVLPDSIIYLSVDTIKFISTFKVSTTDSSYVTPDSVMSLEINTVIIPASNINISGKKAYVIASFNNKVYTGLLNENVLHFYNGKYWQTTNIALSGGINDMKISADKLLITESNSIIILDKDDSITILTNKLFNYPSEAAFDSEGFVWIADGVNGLVSGKDDSYISYYPNGPFSSDVFKLYYGGKHIYALAGGSKSSSGGVGNNKGFYFFENNIWNNINKWTKNFPNVNDLISIVRNPVNNFLYISSNGNGLLEQEPGWSADLFRVYNNYNSPLKTVGVQDSRMSGLAIDKSGNLW